MTSEEWSELWDLLCARFNRDVHAGLATFYLEALEGQLPDAKIREGVRRVLYSDTYWPSPERIVEAARTEQESLVERAVDQWTLCQKAMSDRPRAQGWINSMDEIGKKVVEFMGGKSALLGVKLDEVHHRRREFLSRYKEIAEGRETTPTDELPAITTEGRQLLEEFDSAVREVPDAGG